jgi:regulator of replication initiation timing
MSEPRLPLPGWVQELHHKLDTIAAGVTCREALGAANEAVRRLRAHRESLLKENTKLRAELAKAKAEVEELQQVIIKRLAENMR